MRSVSWALVAFAIACQPKKQAETPRSNEPVWVTPTYPREPVAPPPAPTQPQPVEYNYRYECSRGFKTACEIADLEEANVFRPITETFIDGVAKDNEELRRHYRRLLAGTRSKAAVDQVHAYVDERTQLALKFTFDCFALAKYSSPKGAGDLCKALADNIRWGNAPVYNTAEVARLSQDLGLAQSEFHDLANWEEYRQQQQPASSYE